MQGRRDPSARRPPRAARSLPQRSVLPDGLRRIQARGARQAVAWVPGTLSRKVNENVDPSPGALCTSTRLP